MTLALLALGGNQGDTAGHLRAAVAGLAGVLVAVSGVYQSPAWGDPDQPDYLNAVALVRDPDRTPADWLALARSLEAAAGRVRDPARRYGPRTLDVDIVAVWHTDGEPIISTDPELTLPHPRAHERAFVLRPWLDTAPYAALPGHGWVNDLLHTAPLRDEVRLLVARPEIRLEPAAGPDAPGGPA